MYQELRKFLLVVGSKFENTQCFGSSSLSFTVLKSSLYMQWKLHDEI